MPDTNVPDAQSADPGKAVARFKLAEQAVMTCCYLWHGQRAHRADSLDPDDRMLFDAIDEMRAAGQALRDASK